MLTMLKKDFWYDLPKELIAQEPASPRDAARLMVLSQKDDSIQHKVFRDLPEFLEPGDLLVVNNSKVLPARIVGVKQPTGAVCELLLLRQVKGDQWECLAKPGKRMQPGTKVSFGDGIGEIRCFPFDRSASRIRWLRGRWPVNRESTSQALFGGLIGRDREGASGCI